jgi:hypothetical protein
MTRTTIPKNASVEFRSLSDTVVAILAVDLETTIFGAELGRELQVRADFACGVNFELPHPSAGYCRVRLEDELMFFKEQLEVISDSLGRCPSEFVPPNLEIKTFYEQAIAQLEWMMANACSD